MNKKRKMLLFGGNRNKSSLKGLYRYYNTQVDKIQELKSFLKDLFGFMCAMASAVVLSFLLILLGG